MEVVSTMLEVKFNKTPRIWGGTPDPKRNIVVVFSVAFINGTVSFMVARKIGATKALFPVPNPTRSSPKYMDRLPHVFPLLTRKGI